MVPEFGHFALILALCNAVILSSVPVWGAWRRNGAAMDLAPGLAIGLMVFVTISFASLATAFLQDDFSVKAACNFLIAASRSVAAIFSTLMSSAFSARVTLG